MESSIRQKSAAAKLRQIVSIGIPGVIESIISVFIGSIDTRMISGLGKGAVSAVSFTSPPKLIILSIFFAMGTAVSVFVAQALGHRDSEEANAYFQTILRITVACPSRRAYSAACWPGPSCRSATGSRIPSACSSASSAAS